MTSKQRKADSEIMQMLFRSYGPVWYRGFFSSSKRFGKRLDKKSLESILNQYDASRVFVGHTIFPEIRTFYGGRVVAVDVDAKVNQTKGRSRAVLLDSTGEYTVRDSGRKKPLR